jgi:hypothetical protein
MEGLFTEWQSRVEHCTVHLKRTGVRPGITPKIGRRLLFLDKKEQTLTDHLMRLSDMFYGFNPI